MNNLSLKSMKCSDYIIDKHNFRRIIIKSIKTYGPYLKELPSDGLALMLKDECPDMSNEDIDSFTHKATSAVLLNGVIKKELNVERQSKNLSKEECFTLYIKNVCSRRTMDSVVEHLTNLEEGLENAKTKWNESILTKDGLVNMNPNLDGNIAEQYHVQTFNLNAEASGSEYRAKVLGPGEHGYKKDSVDIVIVDKNGKIVRKYQVKYYKDAESTENAFTHGDYRGQRKLVPEEQAEELPENYESYIEAPDGTRSNSLSKSRAEQLRDEAQNGKWQELGWDEYALTDLAIGIAKKSSESALWGAAYGAGFELAEELFGDEEIKPEEVVNEAIETGADSGIKALLAGALKVSAEKEWIKGLPKGAPAEVYAGMAYIAVENLKISKKIATGEITVIEGIDAIEENTITSVAGLYAMEVGAKAGAAIGSVFGPVGSAIIGFIGGTLGFMGGSEVGRRCSAGFRTLRESACEILSSIGGGIKSVADRVTNTISDAYSSVKDCCESAKDFVCNLLSW